MLYGTLFQDAAEKNADQPFALQNSKMLKLTLGAEPVQMRRGSMVAYQGNVAFEHSGHGGLGKMFRSAATGEGVPLMRATGQGEIFAGNFGEDVHVIYMENDALSINGASILAFSESVNWDIRAIGAGAGLMTGGFYNVYLSGTGFVAFTTKGTPVALNVAEAPTFVDPQAAVAWTGGVQINLRTDTGGLRSLVRGGTGETFQMACSGQGVVFVQPSENVVPNSGQK